MLWKTCFDLKTLNQAFALNRMGYVHISSYERTLIKASVRDAIWYDVTVDMSQPNAFLMECSCPRSQRTDLNYCRHMAAVLYCAGIPSSETETAPPARPALVPNPFRLKDTDTAQSDYRSLYHYFRLQDITSSLLFYDDVVEEAKKLAASRSFIPANVSSGYSSYYSTDEPVLTASAFVDQKPGSRAHLRMILSKDRILMADCGVRSCGCQFGRFSLLNNPQPVCAHLTALLFYLKQYLDSHSLGDATSAAAAQVFSLAGTFRHNAPASGAAAQAANVRLEPRLKADRGSLSVDFKVGTDRLYLVRKLPDLVKLAESGGVLALGKNSYLDFSVHSFSKESEAYYQFIKLCVEDEAIRVQTHSGLGHGASSWSSEAIRSEIPLFGDRLDRFYALTEGRTIPAAFPEKTPDHLFFTGGELRLNLEIHDLGTDDGVFDGIRADVDIPQLYSGVVQDYIIQEDRFLSISHENTRRLKPLLDVRPGPLDPLKIGRRSLASFFHHLLPSMEPYVEITSIDSQRYLDYLPPEVRFAFYLDAEENDITCRLQAIYGEDIFPLAPESHDRPELAAFRDLYAESDTLNYLQTLFPVFKEDEGVFSCSRDDNTIYNLLENGVRHLMNLGEVHTTDRFLALRIRRKWGFSVGVSVENDLMDMQILSDDISPQELLDILKSYRQKKKFHRLKNGDFISLETDSAETLGLLFESLHITPKEFVRGRMQVPAYRALYLDQMLLNHQEVTAARDRTFKALIKEFKTIGDSDFEVPASVQSIVRPYQVYGFRWLMTLRASHFGGILADDMGLGKTLQMICVLLAAREEGKLSPSLVTCPASLVYNWLEELRRFAPALKAAPVVGPKAARTALLSDCAEYDVLVTSYDLLKRDIDDYEGLCFDSHILDEAQYVKNPQSAAAKAVKIIRSSHRYALTGTPIENRLSELWSIFDFLMPGFLYSYEQFRRDFELPIIRDEDDGARDQLKRMVSPFILRRLKADVLKDLPDKLEEIRYASFEDEQRRLYDGQVVRMTNMLRDASDEEFRKNRIQTLAELTRIRQLCCDPSLLFQEYDGGSAKREALMELVREAMEGGHRMLIFSQFTSMLALIEEDLKAAQIPYYLITGSTPKEERSALVSRFNRDDTPVFLISLKAGGTGLNLTGADVVIHYDPWWNLAVQTQATDRAHRIGQTKVVSVFKLIARGTIEEKIVEIQETKKNLADEILGQEGGTLTHMTREDLLELLS